MPMTGGVNIAPGATVSIKLADITEVVSWYLRVTSTDELSTAPTLTGVNPATHKVTAATTVVTFTNSSGRGRALILETSVDDATTTTTDYFSLYTTTTFGTRVPAADEMKESNPDFGWATILNPHLRAGALALQGVAVDPNAPTFGYVLTFNGTWWTPTALPPIPPSFTAGGDLSGTGTSQTVVGLQGVPIGGAAPTLNYILTFNGTHWAAAPAPVSFTAGGDLSGTNTSQKVVQIAGHKVHTELMGQSSDLLQAVHEAHPSGMAVFPDPVNGDTLFIAGTGQNGNSYFITVNLDTMATNNVAYPEKSWGRVEAGGGYAWVMTGVSGNFAFRRVNPVTLTWTDYATSYAGGGFEQPLFDPVTNCVYAQSEDGHIWRCTIAGVVTDMGIPYVNAHVKAWCAGGGYIWIGGSIPSGQRGVIRLDPTTCLPPGGEVGFAAANPIDANYTGAVFDTNNNWVYFADWFDSWIEVYDNAAFGPPSSYAMPVGYGHPLRMTFNANEQAVFLLGTRIDGNNFYNIGMRVDVPPGGPFGSNWSMSILYDLDWNYGADNVIVAQLGPSYFNWTALIVSDPGKDRIQVYDTGLSYMTTVNVSPWLQFAPWDGSVAGTNPIVWGGSLIINPEINGYPKEGFIDIPVTRLAVVLNRYHYAAKTWHVYGTPTGDFDLTIDLIDVGEIHIVNNETDFVATLRTPWGGCPVPARSQVTCVAGYSGYYLPQPNTAGLTVRRPVLGDSPYTVIDRGAVCVFAPDGGPFTVRLPEFPTIGQTVTVFAPAGAAFNSISVEPNFTAPLPINGALTTIVMSTPYAVAQFYFNGTSWIYTSSAPDHTRVDKPAGDLIIPQGSNVFIRAATGGHSYTTPASPKTGDRLTVQGASDASLNTTTIILGGGLTMNGSSANILITTNYAWVEMVFDGTEWAGKP